MSIPTPLQLACITALLFSSNVSAKTVNYDLTIDENKVFVAGKSRKALAINGAIPGPTLRFREGDLARITVNNHLRNSQTSLHWHGLLVPNAMDGVPYLTTPLPIVTGNKLGSMGDPITMVHEGQVVKFCCKPCIKKFKANPEKYLSQL